MIKTMNRMTVRRLVALPTLVILAVALSSCGLFGGKGRPQDPDDRQSRADPVADRGGDECRCLARFGFGGDPAGAGQSGLEPGRRHRLEELRPPRDRRRAEELWNARIPGTDKQRRLAAAPVVGGGTLFVVDTGAVVHAFDADSGAQKWIYKMPAPGKVGSAVFGGGVSYANGKVYATSGVGDVIALDAATARSCGRSSLRARCAARRRSRSTTSS